MAENRYELNKNLAQMLKGGVIMDVTTPEQARIAEEAGACAVMALERIPADIRAAGGISRMSDPKMIKGIQEAVSIPVMAKCRIGHFAEAQILEAIEIDYIDESEVLSPADGKYHIDKTKFQVPFVCGAKDLGEALRRISEGASMIRTKGEPGTGDVIQAVTHMRSMQSDSPIDEGHPMQCIPAFINTTATPLSMLSNSPIVISLVILTAITSSLTVFLILYLNSINLLYIFMNE